MTKSTPAAGTSSTRLVYIAGPMRGLPRWNAAAFESAARRWRARGWEVVSPTEQDNLAGVDVRALPAAELERLGADRAWLRRVICEDVAVVCRAHAVAVLPGWQSSYGATVEVALALFLGLPVYDASTCDEVWPPPRPWALLLAASTITGRGGVAGGGASSEHPSWEDVWRGLGEGRGLIPTNE